MTLKLSEIIRLHHGLAAAGSHSFDAVTSMAILRARRKTLPFFEDFQKVGGDIIRKLLGEDANQIVPSENPMEWLKWQKETEPVLNMEHEIDLPTVEIKALEALTVDTLDALFPLLAT